MELLFDAIGGLMLYQSRAIVVNVLSEIIMEMTLSSLKTEQTLQLLNTC